MTECTIGGCSCEAHETYTRPFWKVTPDDVRERPVCAFHYRQDRLLRNDNGIPVIVSLAVILFGLTNGFTSLPLGLSGVFGWLVTVLFSTIILGFAVLVGVMAVEILRGAYYNDEPVFAVIGNVKNVDRPLDSQTPCIVCMKTDCPGEWRRYTKHVAIFGVPVWCLDDGVNKYCEECAVRN